MLIAKSLSVITSQKFISPIPKNSEKLNIFHDVVFLFVRKYFDIDKFISSVNIIFS